VLDKLLTSGSNRIESRGTLLAANRFQFFNRCRFTYIFPEYRNVDIL